MHLKELILHNVGPYRGRQVIELGVSPGRPIVLFGGLNGCGKTTLLDSLQLALYGNRAQLSNRGSQAYDEYLASLISRGVDLTEGASLSISFTVEERGASRLYQVTRSWSSSGKKVRENLDVFVDGAWDRALSKTWADHIEDLLPLDIAGLFFFDGEKIEALADPETATAVIKEAIHSLLGASTIEQLRADLQVLQRRQVPNSGDASLEQELSDLSEQQAALQRNLDSLDARTQEAHSDLHRIGERLADAEKALLREGGDLFAQRRELEAQRSAVAARLASQQSQLRSLAEGILPLCLVRPRLQRLADEAGLQVEFERQRLLEHLLHERDSWILSLLPDEIASHIAGQLSEDRLQRGSVSSRAAGSHWTEQQTRDLTATVSQLDLHDAGARELLVEIAQSQEDLAHIDSLLGRVPDESRIQTKMAERESALAGQARIRGQLEVLDAEKHRVASELASVESRLGKVEAMRIELGVDTQDKRRIIQHADRVRSTLEALRTRLIKRNIGRIEIATLDSFRRLMRKSELVADLRIHPETYELQLTTQSGDDLPPNRLSAGERQLLAVALLWGLARVAGQSLPLVIDTPLGRLDSLHRAYLVERYFPHAGSQVLLLSTDEEIDAPLYKSLTPSISSAYLLEHDEKQDSTAIRPGYWWEVGTDVA